MCGLNHLLLWWGALLPKTFAPTFAEMQSEAPCDQFCAAIIPDHFHLPITATTWTEQRPLSPPPPTHQSTIPSPTALKRSSVFGFIGITCLQSGSFSKALFIQFTKAYFSSSEAKRDCEERTVGLLPKAATTPRLQQAPTHCGTAPPPLEGQRGQRKGFQVLGSLPQIRNRPF